MWQSKPRNNNYLESITAHFCDLATTNGNLHNVAKQAMYMHV